MFKAYFNLLVTKFQGCCQVFRCLKIMFYNNKVSAFNNHNGSMQDKVGVKFESDLDGGIGKYAKNQRNIQKSLYYSQHKSDNQNMESRLFTEVSDQEL